MSWRQLPTTTTTPDWVRIWQQARQAGDKRVLPEQETGYRTIDRHYHADGGHGPSGYDWDTQLTDHGLMPERDRQHYTAPDQTPDDPPQPTPTATTTDEFPF